MTFKLENLKHFGLVSLVILIAFFMATPQAEGFANLEVKVGDTTGSAGEQNSVISIFMTNWADSVAGFELWLVLSRPDIIEFQTTYDTSYDTTYYRCTTWSGPDCIDSIDVTDSVLADTNHPTIIQYDWTVIDMWEGWIGNHDVSGTLVENWEWTMSKSLGGLGHDLKIAGRANTIPPPFTPGIGWPQLGQIPLIKILADVYDIPDSWEDRTVDIVVQANNLDNFSFSDADGNSIGVITDTIYDSTCFWCEEWVTPDSIDCYLYSDVPCDSIGVVIDSTKCCDTILVGYLDTAYVHIYDGTFTVLAGLCGDSNDDGLVNIFDVTFMIAYLYLGGPPPTNEDMCNVNGDSLFNIFDVTYLISWLYKGGTALDCQTVI